MSAPGSTAVSYDRAWFIEWYRRNRRRSTALFDMLDPGAYHERPIALRNPIVFYEGHLPAFSANTLLRRGLGQAGVDDRLDVLFARGIDPEDESSAKPRVAAPWPAREDVVAYAAAADRRILDALGREDLDRADRPVLRRAEGVYALLEHEAMHQETLLYMWHQLVPDRKRRPADAADRPVAGGEPPAPRTVRVPAGRARLGAEAGAAFGWDNEFPAWTAEVAAFDIDVYDVTNRDYLAFVDAGGYQNRSLWSDEGWRWVAGRARGAPALLGAARRRLGVARHVRGRAAAAGLAGLREPRRSVGLRRVEGAPPADRGRVPPRRVRRPVGRRALAPLGRRAARPLARQLRLHALGPGARRLVPGGRERVGRPRPGRQRLGMDRDGLRRVPGLRADGVVPRGTPPTSSTACTT